MEIIFVIYLVLLLIIYIIGILVNSYLLATKLSKIKNKYSGLIEQFNADKSEKNDLLITIANLENENKKLHQSNYEINTLLASRLSVKELKDLTIRREFLKENSHNDQKEYKSSKNY